MFLVREYQEKLTYQIMKKLRKFGGKFYAKENWWICSKYSIDMKYGMNIPKYGLNIPKYGINIP